MPERPLTPFEKRNLERLNQAGIQSAPLFLTPTGFRKSICDATDPIRRFFLKNGIHDYAIQGQGQDNKRLYPVSIIGNTGEEKREMSLYRPLTKKGDPRLWVSHMGNYAKGDDALAFFVFDGKLNLVNLSRIDFVDSAFVREFFADVGEKTGATLHELLQKLRAIASKPIPAVCSGDTAIGRSIETALGIPMNCSPTPDYKGIELKSKRSESKTRDVLFAQVPDWTLSRLHSSKEMLEEFGYHRDGAFRLYCTVSARKANSQSLFLKVDDAERALWEWGRRKGSSADERLLIWKMDTLENRLETKHRETLWIDADSERIQGKEVFHLRAAKHTAGPNVPQLQRLLGEGEVTVDHLIKLKEDNTAHERGPLFKIAPRSMGQLFLRKPEIFTLA